MLLDASLPSVRVHAFQQLVYVVSASIPVSSLRLQPNRPRGVINERPAPSLRSRVARSPLVITPLLRTFSGSAR